jgi:phosphatidylethanolamine/phosphatidyl-N-methylethanolamine N-methyltransferase
MNDKHGNVEYFYSKHYSELIGQRSSGLLGLLWKYPHKLLEVGHKSNKELEILEIGAGEGEHFSFVTQDFSKYVMSDIDHERLSRSESANQDDRVSFRAADATQLPFLENQFDRTIATCLLIHLLEPEKALNEWKRVTKPGGYVDIYLPCEPGIMLRLFRMVATKPKAEKSGFTGYDLFMARDHLTSTHRLLEILSFVFRDDKISFKFRPFIFRSWYFNLFVTVRIRLHK